MRDLTEVTRRITELEERRDHYIKHTQICLHTGDWHGVEDAGSDIRDIEAQISALKWVCGAVGASNGV